MRGPTSRTLRRGPPTPCALRPMRKLFPSRCSTASPVPQDRGLLRGRGAHAGAGPAGPHHAARDRAHQPVHGPLHGALRLHAGGMAFRALSGRASPRLARCRQRGGARHRRRPFRALPALQGPRPDRRRRGARRGLQAGGPRALPGPRHGRCARQPGKAPGDPGVGHAVDREPRQCPIGPLRLRAFARSLLRRQAPDVETIDLRQHPPERENGSRRCWSRP